MTSMNERARQNAREKAANSVTPLTPAEFQKSYDALKGGGTMSAEPQPGGWTPGPWGEVDRNDEGDIYIARDTHTRYAAIALAYADATDRATEANARLIAAAPEMAALLADSVDGEPACRFDALGGCLTHGCRPCWYAEARALLQRVRGEPA